MNKKVGVGFLVIATLILGLRCNRQSGLILEEWVTGNHVFKIGVTSFAEQYVFPPGAYYEFKVIDKNGDSTEIFTFRHDDPIAINKNGVFFVNDDIAYVYMGWMYAVTTNGGTDWSIWNAENSIAEWKCCRDDFIHKVKIRDDGTGEMFVDLFRKNLGDKLTLLKTADYGITWIRSN